MSESDDDGENVIQELNARFQELRTLIITIGSILAMLMAGLNEVGFIDFAVDKAVDFVKDDPGLNPYLDDCEEVWNLNEDHYIVDNDIIFSVSIADLARCNNVHTVNYNITVDGLATNGTSPEFRNQHSFVEQLDNMSEGTHHAVIEVTNGTIDLFRLINIDFEYDEGEQAAAVYGCTNETALNYNASATHDDGSCEYPQEEEEVTEDCYAEFYDVLSYWENNNTSVYNEFDVDFSCMANVTVFITIDVYNETNVSLWHQEDNFSTYYMDWDYQYLDFYNVPYQDKVNVQYRVYYDGELDDEQWYWLEAT